MVAVVSVTMTVCWEAAAACWVEAARSSAAACPRVSPFSWA